MSARLPPLALLDWGVGGFSVRQALRARVGDLPVTYVSDAGFAPYGTLPRAALARRLCVLVDALARRGVQHVYLACNAASSALPALGPLPVPVEGIVPAGLAAARAFGPCRLGVLGGARTIRSRLYHPLAREGFVVRGRVAQPLSALIEAGRHGTAEGDALVARLLSGLPPCDALLLACTHYPAALTQLARHARGAACLDPAPFAADALAQLEVARRGRPGALDVVLTTGDPAALVRAASRAFGVEVRAVQRWAPGSPGIGSSQPQPTSTSSKA